MIYGNLCEYKTYNYHIMNHKFIREFSWFELGQRPLTPSNQTPPASGHLPSIRGGAGSSLLRL